MIWWKKLNVGDKVECIKRCKEHRESSLSFTKGKQYEVVEKDCDNDPVILDDNGKEYIIYVGNAVVGHNIDWTRGFKVAYTKPAEEELEYKVCDICGNPYHSDGNNYILDYYKKDAKKIIDKLNFIDALMFQTIIDKELEDYLSGMCRKKGNKILCDSCGGQIQMHVAQEFIEGLE